MTWSGQFNFHSVNGLFLESFQLAITDDYCYGMNYSYQISE